MQNGCGVMGLPLSFMHDWHLSVSGSLFFLAYAETIAIVETLHKQALKSSLARMRISQPPDWLPGCGGSVWAPCGKECWEIGALTHLKGHGCIGQSFVMLPLVGATQPANREPDRK